MRERGRFADAEPSAERALALRRALAGPRAPDTADSLSTLGLIRTIRGRVIEGGALIAEAVEIWRGTTGPDSPEFAKGVRNLVRTWRERADYPRADAFERADLLKVERFERELLAARRKTFGDTHPLTAESQGSLGQLLHAMGRDREAEPLLREALATRRATLGRESHPGVIEAIHNLALALHDQRKLDEAVPLYRSSVALLRKGLPNHPQIAINLSNYGRALEDAGTLAEAEAAYREAIGIRRELVGRERAGVARTLGNLARVLAKQGRTADALRAAEEAVAIDRSELGASHAETVRATRLRDSLAGNRHGRPD
jgi:serine/threonine-protein kinase